MTLDFKNLFNHFSKYARKGKLILGYALTSRSTFTLQILYYYIAWENNFKWIKMEIIFLPFDWRNSHSFGPHILWHHL